MTSENSQIKPAPGIYQLRNTSNNKRYIGLSNNVRRRKIYHYGRLRKQLHDNTYLQRAWNIDPNAFVFEVIEYCDVSQLEDREIYWISHFDATNRDYGYNILSGGNHLVGESASWWGRKHTSETKAKMSESARTRPSNRLPKSKEFVEHLREICAGDKNPFYGRKHSPESLRVMSEKARMYHQTHKNPRCVGVVKLSESGELICTYPSVKEAATAVDRSYCVISDVCRGVQKTAAGYKWMYESDYLAMIGGDASSAS